MTSFSVFLGLGRSLFCVGVSEREGYKVGVLPLLEVDGIDGLSPAITSPSNELMRVLHN